MNYCMVRLGSDILNNIQNENWEGKNVSPVFML